MVTLQKLKGFLKKHQKVGLDSNILIYLIENNPHYSRLTKEIFQAIEKGQNQGVCSTLSLLEVLVQPYRLKNDELVNQFYGLLTTYPYLIWEEFSSETADIGARFRAQYNLKTPDAILAATASHSGATGFIGNDVQLKKVKELDVLILSR
ncbi:MAG TPA: PIN domain-containing protein [Nitrospiria bacterium]|jgi:predicted nucleic acid-binding protein